jgi:hypothetical protein
MNPNARTRVCVLSILLAVLIVVEVVDAVLMARHGEYRGAIVHSALTLVFLTLIVPAISRQAKPIADSAGRLTTQAAFCLSVASLALLIIIAIHDFDHMRQAMMWGYRFSVPLLVVNFIVYVPGLAALLLASTRNVLGAVATAIAGPLIALSFLKLHMFGAWFPVWGPWNDSFIVLGADTLSWWILWLTATVGVLVGLIGTFVLGAVSESARIWFRPRFKNGTKPGPIQ